MMYNLKIYDARSRYLRHSVFCGRGQENDGSKNQKNPKMILSTEKP